MSIHRLRRFAQIMARVWWCNIFDHLMFSDTDDVAGPSTCKLCGHKEDGLEGYRPPVPPCERVLRVKRLYEEAVGSGEGFWRVDEELGGLDLELDYNHHLSIMKAIARKVLGDSCRWEGVTGKEFGDVEIRVLEG